MCDCVSVRLKGRCPKPNAVQQREVVSFLSVSRDSSFGVSTGDDHQCYASLSGGF